MTDTTTPTAIREVIFNDGTNTVVFPLVGTDGGVQFSDLARFQPKMLFGDPSKDDNDLLSSWQISDLSGGHGVVELKEGTDAGRYAFGTTLTRYPGQIARGYYVEEAQAFAGAGTYEVLGDLYCNTPDVFALVVRVGTSVYRCTCDHGTIDVASAATLPTAVSTGLTNAPVARGTGFQGTALAEVFYIPLGNNGYATCHQSSATVSNFATPKFRAFTVWDNKLLGVTTGGRLYWCIDTTTWTAYDLTYALPRQYYIRDILTFFDRRDEPCVFVLTEREMFQFDPDGPELFPIDFSWPAHGRRVQAAAVWQGQLFIAVGMGVFRYTSGTWMAVGLDRDDGLPAEYRGYIADLAPGFNGLYALVRGEDKGSSYGGKSSVHEFSGSGWQTIWTQDGSTPASDQYHGLLAQTPQAVTRIVTSRAKESSATPRSTLAWDQGTLGVAGLNLPTDFANPRQTILTDLSLGIQNYYWFETGEFDADMEGYTKIANAIQFTLERPYGNSASVYETLRILYRADRGEWVRLWNGQAMEGRYSVPFGRGIGVSRPAPGHPSDTLHTGLSFEKIQFRIEWHGSSAAADPALLSNFVFSFLKTVSSNDSFTITVDCSRGSGDYGPQELMDYIDNLTSVKQFGVMTIGEYSYRVFVAQNGGTRYGGDSQFGMRSLSVVEISTQL